MRPRLSNSSFTQECSRILGFHSSPRAEEEGHASETAVMRQINLTGIFRPFRRTHVNYNQGSKWSSKTTYYKPQFRGERPWQKFLKPQYLLRLPCSNNTSKHNLLIVINNHYRSTLNRRTRWIFCKCRQYDNLLDNILGISLKIQNWVSLCSCRGQAILSHSLSETCLFV